MGAASGKAGDYRQTAARKWRAVSLLDQKIWLPKFIYVAIPYVYLACGACAFFATLYVADWFWLVPHYLLLSAGCVHMSIWIFRRRSRRGTARSERPE
jgi:hypothetical protein